MSIFRHRKDSHAPIPVSSHGPAGPTEDAVDAAGGGLALPVRPDAIRNPSSIYRPTRGLHVGFAQDEPQPNEIKLSERENADDTLLSPASGTVTSPPATHPSETQHLSGNI